MNPPSDDGDRDRRLNPPTSPSWPLLLFILVMVAIAVIASVVTIRSANEINPHAARTTDVPKPTAIPGPPPASDLDDHKPDSVQASPASTGSKSPVSRTDDGSDHHGSASNAIPKPDGPPKASISTDTEPAPKPNVIAAHDDPAASPPSNPPAPNDATQKASANPSAGDDHPENHPGYYGKNEPVAANATPQAASVAEALKDKNHPERLSPLVQPKPFNADEYLKDPKAYCDTVEPGRVFQSKDPAEGVNRIQAVTPLMHEIQQGQSVALSVQAEPGFPVSFTSFDLGRFSESQLNAVTVKADASGIATVHFEGSSGTIREVNILASSPVTSGQLKFTVNVTKPE